VDERRVHRDGSSGNVARLSVHVDPMLVQLDGTFVPLSRRPGNVDKPSGIVDGRPGNGDG